MNKSRIAEFYEEHFSLEAKYARQILTSPKNSAQRKKLLKEGYNEVLSLSEKYGFNFSSSDHTAVIVKLIKKILPEKQKKILDYGCGEGNLLMSLAEDGYENLEGIDISEIEIKKAQEKIKLLNLNAVFRSGEIWEIKNTYDLIVMDNIIEHIPPDEVDDLIVHIKNLLNLNGKLLIITPHVFAGPHDISGRFLKLGQKAEGFHFKEYKLKDLRDLLKQSGFQSILSYSIHPRLLGQKARLLQAREIYVNKSIFLENIFSIDFFSKLLKINKQFTRLIISLFFPAIIVASK